MVAGQIGAVVLGLGALTLAPPARGQFLLVPVTGHGAAMIAVAAGHGARLVGLGPLPASIVVEGDRDRLAAPLRAEGVLMLAAPATGCRTTPESRA
ncbi:hypothetical protein PQ455_04820 [Sphingomonas naphthae]|uniref:Alcohol dehydrogenase-like C-terminal domain-containing protein n=1 Tax=Sphingomonas naphthae TaxID=1813468 RepID=A0ABY7TR20_9SPHN|nr:hypothetical protein [Sphingomonas naphthae]WCT75390.1 hypothetical protein PQ455_04820 [Sphingomonas naphthae]